MITDAFIRQLLDPAGDYLNWRNFIDDIANRGSDTPGAGIEANTELYNARFKLVNLVEAEWLAKAEWSKHVGISKSELLNLLSRTEDRQEQLRSWKDKARRNMELVLSQGMITKLINCETPITVEMRGLLRDELKALRKKTPRLASGVDYAKYLWKVHGCFLSFLETYADVILCDALLMLLRKELSRIQSQEEHNKKLEDDITPGTIAARFVKECHDRKLLEGVKIDREVLYEIMKAAGAFDGPLANFNTRVRSYRTGRALAKRYGYAKARTNKTNRTTKR